ncbi:uncharacterized protein Z519_06753 [Cladophialophora bantiana CBS 173.52]|uniref:Nudix hydrolase domain-containing protein n=1 Tax=Cladophialophora bantiana (strain ATCC 10958 / CBS 173.52 / CDC B-1940 / NIH 8579) TaxID=1442370 RepID=A0A0D2I7W5_CLAB1|nr:uncharacterized protein Z519_06753 [Cladophialophora bantiana CBS 173.52]KIW92904.1 hypothetical protein Z519_06753 [Cladophialophora bantiana CBS 173.52]
MSEDSRAIIKVLEKVLIQLSQNPYPHVPNPLNTSQKRASVAAIIRVRPAYKPVPANVNGSIVAVDKPSPPSPPSTISEFFAQEWVQEGDPELLFIKRAGRAGDRWSGHVALPGGKRDPEDADDFAAAIRETREEIGLDLDTADCLPAGNLPERLVTTSWGKDVLMVLCPYIFLLTGKAVPPVQPQPTEVASVHWVSLRALLTPTLRTREAVDISSRMAKHVGPTIHRLIRWTMGKMIFSAVRLLPTESIYASSIPGFIPTEGGDNLSTLSGWAQAPFGIPSSASIHRSLLTFQQPLILWGLTLGVLADLLDQLPPYNAVALWKYPTFTVPDLRLLVYIMTHSFRKNTAETFSSGSWPSRLHRRPSQTAIDGASEAIAISVAEPAPAMGPESASAPMPAATKAHSTRGAKRSSFNKHSVGIGGLGVGKDPHHAVGKLLYGYYDRVNWAIALFLAYRTALTVSVAWWVVRWWRRRRAAAT